MSALHADARAIFDAAVAAADPAECVRRALKGRTLDGPFTVLGAGKAAVPMLRALESRIPIESGIVVTARGCEDQTQRNRVMIAGHPLPDDASVWAGSEVLQIAARTERQVIFLLSGGASALLCAPVEGITLSDKQTTTDLLLKAGATIRELNCVRKHLSRIKGGQLARQARGRVLSLILSDVVGDPLDVIGSGPTAPDPSTFAEAREVVRRLGIEGRLPEAVRRHLQEGKNETPKPDDPIFNRVENCIVGNNRMALEGAQREARRLGYRVEVLKDPLQGGARDAGQAIVRRSMEEGTCLLSGGETTVTVRGPGRGGRCQELALSAAIELAGTKDIVLLAGGTDGVDGPTDAAGAIVDGSTADAGARGALDANDAYPYLEQRNALLKTGPTGTNVMDIVVMLRAG